MIRCKLPLAEITTRSIGVNDPAIDTDVSQPPIISPANRNHEARNMLEILLIGFRHLWCWIHGLPKLFSP